MNYATLAAKLVADRLPRTVLLVTQGSICSQRITVASVATSMDTIKILLLKPATNAIQVVRLVVDQQQQAVFLVLQENICLPQITVV